MLDLTVENVTKRYSVQRMTRTDGRRRTLADRLRARADDFWALRDVSLRGGARRNARHHRPQRRRQEHASSSCCPASRRRPRARFAITAGVGALIEVGSGFHPELTGRENIYLSGSILGMRRRRSRTSSIASSTFAGVERLHRHAGQALLVRHVCAPRLLDRGAP